VTEDAKRLINNNHRNGKVKKLVRPYYDVTVLKTLRTGDADLRF